MADEAIALMAHLMRRVGVGATRDELEVLATRPYEEVVEDLVHPERFEDDDVDALDRYFPTSRSNDTPTPWVARWLYQLINSRRPLRHKMALFWHQVFATGWFKSEHGPSMAAQIETFKENGLSNLRQILLDLSRDPAMIYWLDNCENQASAINENYGRELLELFSMGIGNYTETDIKEAARAFTGWTFAQPIPLYPFGGYPSHFVYRADQHDDSEKTFLGHTGNFNGEHIIDIIVQEEACARFIARHLYNYFVADEPQVPAWSVTPPQDPAAIDLLVAAYQQSDADMRVVMRALLNSEAFKAARFRRVKSPAELVAGAVKLSGALSSPDPLAVKMVGAAEVMGQKLMDPPSVEGWHTGKEWIDGGTLTERVNFAVDQVADPKQPGVKAILRRLAENGEPLTPEAFVERCLDLVGSLEVGEDTRQALDALAAEGGPLSFADEAARAISTGRVTHMLSMIVAAPEYQFC
ncbi:MAG: DUF1800 domain-containing protein [Chloroflexi bacterium]|nr:DUF1800 domain-containing protein [Chloroflexota bacterium]MDA1001993.1 DUF1800 domain-containing protein [Chloroflexota bacterium]